tara:strand:+ start:1266 stop:2288 length:1023 start_codon:yes stop_codon:yes gene_type:complete
MKSTRKNALAILLALLMTVSALAGCSGTDETKDIDDPVELEEWNVFLVQMSSDLPNCDSATDGRLYYVQNQAGFQACSSGSWVSIDLTGAEGAQGPTGPDGAQGSEGKEGPQGPVGPAGSDGEQGPAGPPGLDGTSFTIIGTVEETTDLGEVYIGDTGDAFMVNETVHIHVWSGSEWIDLGNISGPQGAAGPQGPPGADGEDGSTGGPGPSGQQGVPGADGEDGSMPVVMEMSVTVSSMDFYIDSIQQADVTLYRGFTYTFDQSASSNSPHPFRLSETSDGTHGGGSEYTDGVTYTGSQGSNGLLTFTVPLDAPDTLYYFCQNHGSMGGEITIQSLGSVS